MCHRRPQRLLAPTYALPNIKTKLWSTLHGISIYVQPRCGSCGLATSARATIPLPCARTNARTDKSSTQTKRTSHAEPRVRTYVRTKRVRRKCRKSRPKIFLSGRSLPTRALSCGPLRTRGWSVCLCSPTPSSFSLQQLS